MATTSFALSYPGQFFHLMGYPFRDRQLFLQAQTLGLDLLAQNGFWN